MPVSFLLGGRASMISRLPSISAMRRGDMWPGEHKSGSAPDSTNSFTIGRSLFNIAASRGDTSPGQHKLGSAPDLSNNFTIGRSWFPIAASRGKPISFQLTSAGRPRVGRVYSIRICTLGEQPFGNIQTFVLGSTVQQRAAQTPDVVNALARFRDGFLNLLKRPTLRPAT